MTAPSTPMPPAGGAGAAPVSAGPGWRRIVRDQPLVPLVILLVALVGVLQLVQPGTVKVEWVTNIIRFAIPLAILGAAQTLVMLTGGIDLSAATIASLGAYVAATQVRSQGDEVAIALGLGAAVIVGAINGLGIAVFRVQPLIMTLAMGLVTAGFLTVYAERLIATTSSPPAIISALGAGTISGVLPTGVLLFVPLAAIILFGLRRSGYGRLLYAVGDNPTASRLAGVRVWQVLLVVYVIAAVLAALAGFMYSAIGGSATLSVADPFLLPSIAAVVIGGTSIFGGRGGYAGTIVGALILTVLVSLMTAIDSPQAIRQIVYGAIILIVAAAYTRITDET